MKRPIVSKKSLDLQSNHFLRRNPGYPLGLSLGELDYLRGHKDDFFGDLLLDEYTTEIAGVNSIVATLWNNDHGGWANFQSGDAAGRFSRLWLGDAADGYATLDADEGWVQMVRMRLNVIGGDFIQYFGTTNAARTRTIRAGDSVGALNNWTIYCQDALGNSNTNSGIATDTDWHWHVLDVYPITGGRQVDYYLDGALIATQTTNVPTEVLTPAIISRSRDAVIRNMDVDYWAVIPRNL